MMKATRVWMGVLALGLALAGNALGEGKKGVELTQEDGILKVNVNGVFFSDYHFKDVSRPFFYPVIGPTGAGMTRNWPMKEVEGEDQDHIHHRGIWYAHGLINGEDFWEELPYKDVIPGTTVQEKFEEISSGIDQGSFTTLNKLVSHEGKVLGTDRRTMTIYARDNDRIIDFKVTLMASHGDLLMGDTKEGSMGIRLPRSMQLAPATKATKDLPNEGHIVMSTGVRDKDAWGKRADWVDYYGPVDGKTVGVAMFDHPDNPRHPTWWHVRPYGLFAANPFGRRYFENLEDKHAGEMNIPAGESVTFNYRFYIHAGDEKDAKVAEHYQAYVAGKL